MPAPVPLAVRQRIFQGLQRDLKPAALARELQLPERTVRALYARFRAGAETLTPSYRRPVPATPSSAIQQALLLHEQHPSWGAPYLLLRLHQLHPEFTDLPSARTLQRWFGRQQQPPALPGRKPASTQTAPGRPHAVWEMDAVEQRRLQSGVMIAWLRWVDEFSGAVLGTVVFPLRQLRPGASAGGAAGRARAPLALWGLPTCLRVDNGLPWGSWNDLPTPFALWVVGLGVRWHWNEPRCPQQNPKVERSQGTGKRWAEPGTCRTGAELQGRLDEADLIQREHYVTRAGASRLDLFPELRHSGRKYSAAWEARTWSLRLVEEHLAEYVAVRRVGSGGSVSVYDRLRYVGRQYAGGIVQVQYDPEAHGWIITDEEGRALRRHPAPEINRAQIVKMNLKNGDKPS